MCLWHLWHFTVTAVRGRATSVCSWGRAPGLLERLSMPDDEPRLRRRFTSRSWSSSFLASRACSARNRSVPSLPTAAAYSRTSSSAAAAAAGAMALRSMT